MMDPNHPEYSRVVAAITAAGGAMPYLRQQLQLDYDDQPYDEVAVNVIVSGMVRWELHRRNHWACHPQAEILLDPDTGGVSIRVLSLWPAMCLN